MIFLLLTNVACANEPIKVTLFPSQKIKESELPLVEIYNGKVKVYKFNLLEKSEHPTAIICEGVKVPYQLKNQTLELFLTTGYYAKPREFFCEAENSKHERKQFLKVKMLSFTYGEEHIKGIDKAKVEPSPKDLKRVEEEQKILNKIYSIYSEQLYFSGPFAAPLDSVRTSIYGNKRILNNTKISTHLGNDFRAAEGTPVPVTNDGKVVFVGDLFFSGNTVIIDHGMSVFSMYAHLSAIKVKVDDTVKKGDVIALSGATGRVNGPHLHWGVKINGEWIDGVSLVEESTGIVVKN